jgi:hypothetical protein
MPPEGTTGGVDACAPAPPPLVLLGVRPAALTPPPRPLPAPELVEALDGLAPEPPPPG